MNKTPDNNDLDDILHTQLRSLRDGEEAQVKSTAEFAASLMQRLDNVQDTLPVASLASGAHAEQSHTHRERGWTFTFAVLLGALVCLPSLQSLDSLQILVELSASINPGEWLRMLPTTLDSSGFALLSVVLLLPLMMVILEE